jgi:hypothetical protein
MVCKEIFKPNVVIKLRLFLKQFKNEINMVANCNKIF